MAEDQDSHAGLPRPEVDPLVLQRQRRKLFAELLGVEVEGPRLDHYELLHELGRGAMGVVYAAHDTELDRKVAIKQLTGDDPDLRSRLIAEARAMAKLNHPNVVPVHEIGEAGETAFIVMALVEGRPLRAWLEAEPRSLEAILAVFRDAGRGLAAVHAKGLVHRDFKPDNVMVGEDGRARVMDFGIARAEGSDSDGSSRQTPGPNPRAPELSQTGALVGTPAYMAPEQLRGLDATPASDQFAFCVALHEAIHGVRPFEAESLPGLLAAIDERPREPAPGDSARLAAPPSPALRRVLNRGLAASSSERFASMEALLDALDQASAPQAPPAWVHLVHHGRDSPAVLGLASALLERGLRPWFRPWEGATDRSSSAAQALTDAPALLLCHSPAFTPIEDPQLRAALDARLARGDRPTWVVPLSDPEPAEGGPPSSWAELERLAPDGERIAAQLGVREFGERDTWLAEEAERAGVEVEQLCPYPGPGPMAEADARWMFGREHELAELIARLADGPSRFWAVVGPSGVGKSSLVRAGLCPLVRAGALDAGRPWTIATMRPGPEPCIALAQALVALGPELGIEPSKLDVETLSAAFRTDRGALARVLGTRREPDRPLLLIVDPLEDLFIEAGLSPGREPGPARALVDNLVRATRGPTGLHVVATLRTDFFDRCLAIAPLARVLRAGSFPLGPMRAGQVRAAIELPLRRVGYTIAGPVLAELVASVSEQGERLPLLQHVLVALWAARERDARALTHAAYRASGGIEDALTRGADSVLDRLRRELGAAGERSSRRILTRLVSPGDQGRGDVRRRASRSELVDDELSARVLDALVGEARIVVALGHRREHYALAHEPLVREWAPLVAWLDAERSALRLRQELRASAERFAAHAEDPAWLWARSRVDEADRILAASEVELATDERTFLDRSAARVRLRERRIWIGLGATFAILFALLGYAFRLAAINRNQADQNQELTAARAEAEARASDGRHAQTGLRATMLARESHDIEALLLAIEALGAYPPGLGRPPPREAYEGALAALAMDELLGPRARVEAGTHRIVDLAFSPAGRWLASAGFDGRALLLDANSGQVHASLEGHTSPLTALAFSPAGRQLATASWDRSVRLWNCESGTLEAVLEGHDDHVLALAFSPAGDQLASAGADASIRVWNPNTGAAIRRLEGHAATVSALAFSPTGETLASASHDTSVRVWDPTTGALLQVLDEASSRLTQVEFSPAGESLVSCGYEPIVHRWSAATGAPLASLVGHRSTVLAFAFAPAGQTLATASEDDTARLWDLSSGETLVRFEGHHDDILDLAFSADGSQLVTGSADGSARVWESASGRALARLGGGDPAVLAVATSPGLPRLATASAEGSVMLWAPASPSWTMELRAHTGPVSALAHSADGALVSAGHDGQVRQWPDTRKPTAKHLGEHDDAVLAVALAPAGQTLASAGRDSSVQLWDLASGQRLARFEGHTSHVVTLAFSPTGERLASGGYDTDVRVWGTRTRTLLDSLHGHEDYVSALVFDPQGSTLASASHDTTVRLWDPEIGQQRAVLEGHRDDVLSLAFAPDGATLASGGADHDLRLWDVGTASPLVTLRGHRAPVTELMFAPEGQRLISAAADGELRLWVLSEDRQTASSSRLGGHGGEVLALALGPAGRLLATASTDDEVRLWDLDLGQLLARLEGHRDDVLSLSFAPDGRSFVSGDAEGLIRRWPTPAHALALSCARAAPFLEFLPGRAAPCR